MVLITQGIHLALNVDQSFFSKWYLQQEKKIFQLMGLGYIKWTHFKFLILWITYDHFTHYIIIYRLPTFHYRFLLVLLVLFRLPNYGFYEGTLSGPMGYIKWSRSFKQSLRISILVLCFYVLVLCCPYHVSITIYVLFCP